jgi:hypothetical protein
MKPNRPNMTPPFNSLSFGKCCSVYETEQTEQLLFGFPPLRRWEKAEQPNEQLPEPY